MPSAADHLAGSPPLARLLTLVALALAGGGLVASGMLIAEGPRIGLAKVVLGGMLAVGLVMTPVVVAALWHVRAGWGGIIIFGIPAGIAVWSGLAGWDDDGFFAAAWTAHGLVLPAAVLAPPREPRRTPGRCGGCGYDLRGIDSDRCPECGMGPGTGIVGGSRRRHVRQVGLWAAGAVISTPAQWLAFAWLRSLG